MFKQTFHSALAAAREASGFSIRQLKKACGLAVQRISRLERGIVLPTPMERDALSTSLQTHAYELLHAPSRPQRHYQRLRNRGARFLPTLEPYYPPRDRRSGVRLAAAHRRYPSEMNKLVRLLARSPDFDDVNFFCESVALDSGLECLFLTSLFADGADPLFVAPYLLAPRLEQAVICPKKQVEVGFRPFPCVKLENALYIPQVAFRTPGTFVVDFLRYEDGAWSAVEIDGRGHDFGRDAEKEAALAVPVVRFSEERVLEWVHGVLERRWGEWAA
ncbi:MAG TPA: XRE family transcriptional regulator [Phycisphaerales bacterium]|nr:XRE family transcriptional regulator [Phycisphaerales bacterium]